MRNIHTESSACFEQAALPLLVDPMKSHGPWPAHYHGYEELVIIEGGTAEHRVDGRARYPLVPGDVFVIKPRSSHGYEKTKGFDVVTLRFDIERLDLPHARMRAIPGFRVLFDLEPRYRRRHGFNSRLHLSMHDLDYALAVTRSLGQELRAREPGYEFVAQSIFVTLIGFLCRCYSRATSAQSRNLLRVEKAIRHLEAHDQEDISVGELARLTGQSVNSLLRDFKYATGQTPVQYRLSLRLKKGADRLVQHPECTVTQTALACGFNDSNYFSRQFRRRFKMSPSEFRRQAHGTRGDSGSAESAGRNARATGER